MEKEPTSEASVVSGQELMSPRDQTMNELAGGLVEPERNIITFEDDPVIELPEHMPESNKSEAQELLPEKIELSEKSKEELKNASGFIENFITSFSDSNIKSTEQALGPDVLGSGVKHEVAVSINNSVLPEVAKGLIHGVFDLNETISQETKSVAKERIDSYMAEIKETGQDPYEVMAEFGNFTKALNSEHYLPESENNNSAESTVDSTEHVSGIKNEIDSIYESKQE